MFGNEKVAKKGNKRVHETVVEASKRHRKSNPVIVLCMEEDEDDYSVSLEVETKGAEGGSAFLKHVKVNLLSHCVFCLRKTTNGPVNPETDSEDIQVVPRAVFCSSWSSGQFLPTFNRTWRHLQMKSDNGNKQDDPLLNFTESIPLGGAGVDEVGATVRFLDLPTMCEFCVAELEMVDQLFKDLQTQLDVIGRIVQESKHTGKYPLRAKQFQESLKTSNLEGQVVTATINLLDKLGGCSPQVSCDFQDESIDDVGVTDGDPLSGTDPVPNSPSSWTSLLTPQNESSLVSVEEPGPSKGHLYSQITYSDKDEEADEDFADENDWNATDQDSDCVKSEADDEDGTSENGVSSEYIFKNGTRMSTRNAPNTQCMATSLEPRNGRDNEKGASDDFVDEGDWTDNDQDSDYVKSEPDDDSSEDDTSEEDFKITTRTPKRQNPKRQRPSNSNQIKNLTTKIQARSSSSIANTYRKLDETEKSNIWDKMVKSKSFSKSTDWRSGSEKFTCRIYHCRKSFNSQSDLMDHQVTAHSVLNGGAYQCQSCSKSFWRVHSLERHKQEVHKEFATPSKTLKCGLCKADVPSKELLEHVRAHVGDEYLIKCPNQECLSAFISVGSLRTHIVLGNNPCKKSISNYHEFFDAFNICQECGYKAEQRRKLRSHLFREHETATKDFACPIDGCLQQFSTKQSVAFHIARHNVLTLHKKQSCSDCSTVIELSKMEKHLKEAHKCSEIIKCQRCPFLFSSMEFLVEHMCNHRDGGLSCHICPGEVKFSFRFQLLAHYYSKHQIGNRYSCSRCTFVTLSQQQLDDHCKRSHVGDDSSGDVKKKKVRGAHKCDICFAVFLKSFTLLDHKIKEHGSTVLHSCKSCKETFRTYALLLKHERVHSGGPPQPQKLFKCDVEGCGKSFEKNCHLKHHVSVVHLGERKHVCELCGKAYTEAQGLKYHMDSVHLGLRPYRCECGESFSSGTVLRRHQLIHTGERAFVCEECGQRFRHKEVLRRHLQGHRTKGADFKPNGPMKQIRKRVEKKSSA